MEGCELCETLDWAGGETYQVIACNTCNYPMLVLREHRKFTAFEKALIVKYCGYKRVRFKHHKIQDHGHAHFYDPAASGVESGMEVEDE
jgi:hypothetical protein